jgi:hypothetical protein
MFVICLENSALVSDVVTQGDELTFFVSLKVGGIEIIRRRLTVKLSTKIRNV